MGSLESVNLGRLQPNPRYARAVRRQAQGNRKPLPTGIDKRSVDGPVEVRAPGPKTGGLGSGLVGDEIGDHGHHGGDSQAVYAVSREELDEWQVRLGRDLRNGSFGENLTTVGVVVSDAVIGERWQVGPSVLLQVTGPRIPCGTFRHHLGEKGWLKTFTEHGKSGAYLRVVRPGAVRAGDAVEVVHRPAHGVTVSSAFRALTLEPALLPGLLAAGDDLDDELTTMAQQGRTYSLEP